MRYSLFIFLSASFFVFSCSSKSLDTQSCKDNRFKNGVEDKKLEKVFTSKLNKLIAAQKTAVMSTLHSQLNQKQCQLKLKPNTLSPKNATDIYQSYQNSILMVGERYKCKKCTHWHLAISTGFMITESALVTSYHIIDNGKNYVGVMTSDQKVYGIKKVLAADPENDFVILQLNASGFTPMPLHNNAPVGTKIYAISHPDSNYYTMADGIVARYFTPQKYKKSGAVYMSVTADFAKGSSGGPIVDDQGRVVGMVSYTRSIYYDRKRQHLQMVLKNATTAKAILAVIKQE